MCDNALVSFLANISKASPDTRVLIYSRGTDENWTNENFRVQWKKDAEERFPCLKDRVSTMWIQEWKGGKGSFKNPATAKDIRDWVEGSLPPPKNTG
jgi:hypothetical protein